MKTPRPRIDLRQKILYQAFVALGEGAGNLRVPRATCEAIHDHYSAFLDRPEVRRLLEDPSDPWGRPEHGAQALERVRATGRLAALIATREGRTEIHPQHFAQAAQTVEAAASVAKGSWCPPPPPGGGG